MAYAQQKKSEKLHVIDHETFEHMQQLQLQNQSHQKNNAIIRNAKYKKMHSSGRSTFNLLNFVKKPKTAAERRNDKRSQKRRRVTTMTTTLKRKGKTREGGRKKKFSRLKKAILRYRLKKLNSYKVGIDEVSENFKKISLEPQNTMQQFIKKEEEEDINVMSCTPSFLYSQANEGVSQRISVDKVTQPLKKELVFNPFDQENTILLQFIKNPFGKDNSDVCVENASPSNLHSRRFRSYCDNCTTSTLAELTERLLRELHRFQRRAFEQNEIKARAHRRFVIGFREVQNYLRINKLKLVLIAPDCETCDGEAGLDETIAVIKHQCQIQNIPYAFALRRRQLAYALYKKVPIGCVGILNYDGAREIFAELLNSLQVAKANYAAITNTSLPNI